MNLPNKLTISRICLTLVFILFVLKEGSVPKMIATLVFMLASFTDFLDGRLARKHHLETRFGKIMDPIADKFLMLSAFFVFVKLGLIAAWMFWIIFIREVGITFIRLYAMKQGKVLAAENMGKIKTASQVAIVFFILAFLALKDSTLTAGWPAGLWHLWDQAIFIFMIAVVLLTVLSGISFLKNNANLKDV